MGHRRPRSTPPSLLDQMGSSLFPNKQSSLTASPTFQQDAIFRLSLRSQSQSQSKCHSEPSITEPRTHLRSSPTIHQPVLSDAACRPLQLPLRSPFKARRHLCQYRYRHRVNRHSWRWARAQGESEGHRRCHQVSIGITPLCLGYKNNHPSQTALPSQAPLLSYS